MSAVILQCNSHENIVARITIITIYLGLLLLQIDRRNICFVAHNYDFAGVSVHDMRNVVCPTFFHCSDNDFIRRLG